MEVDHDPTNLSLASREKITMPEFVKMSKPVESSQDTRLNQERPTGTATNPILQGQDLIENTFQVINIDHDVKQALDVELCQSEQSETKTYGGSMEYVSSDSTLNVIPDVGFCQTEEINTQFGIIAGSRTESVNGREMAVQYDIEDQNGKHLTELTVLTGPESASDGDLLKMVDKPATDGTEKDVTQQVVTSDANSSEVVDKCRALTDDIYSAVKEPLEKFWKKFETNSEVLCIMEKLLNASFWPLFNQASCGDEAKCLELSNFSTKLLSVLWPSSLGLNCNPMSELLQLIDEYSVPNIVPEHLMPPMDHEVQVVNDQPSSTVTLMDTFAMDIKAGNTMMDVCSEKADYEKPEDFVSMRNPLWQDVSHVELPINAEQDLGIVLNRNNIDDDYCFRNDEQQITQDQCDEQIMSQSDEQIMSPLITLSGEAVTSELKALAQLDNGPPLPVDISQPAPYLDDILRDVDKLFCFQTPVEAAPPDMSHIPSTVAQVAALSDEDEGFPKRKRKTQGRNFGGSGGKRLRCGRHDKNF